MRVTFQLDELLAMSFFRTHRAYSSRTPRSRAFVEATNRHGDDVDPRSAPPGLTPERGARYLGISRHPCVTEVCFVPDDAFYVRDTIAALRTDPEKGPWAGREAKLRVLKAQIEE